MSRPAWVNEFIGLPFQTGGRGPEYFDCWGLVAHVLKRKFRITVPLYSERDYNCSDIVELNEIINSVKSTGLWTQVTIPCVSDVVLFRVSGRECHVGLVVETGWMLHSWRNTNSTAERYDGPLWRNRIAGYWRWNQNVV